MSWLIESSGPSNFTLWCFIFFKSCFSHFIYYLNSYSKKLHDSVCLSLHICQIFFQGYYFCLIFMTRLIYLFLLCTESTICFWMLKYFTLGHIWIFWPVCSISLAIWKFLSQWKIPLQFFYRKFDITNDKVSLKLWSLEDARFLFTLSSILHYSMRRIRDHPL